jgi:predicted ATPase
MVEPVAEGQSVPGNLPLQITSFVGRETEIAAVKRLLGTTRLLTLAGAGGCGKSRLALRVGEDVLRGFADGAWQVELAALSDPALIPQTVATALGLRDAAGRPLLDQLIDYLRGRSLLLILDNCEHLVAACAQFAETLLRLSPGLTILTTSRHVLGVTGETAWRVLSLAVPDLQSPPPLERLTHYEAVQLFIDRAGAAQPSLQVTTQNAPAVARICHQLDGIPLAIELAAARSRVFSVEQIAARLDDRFRLLTSGPRTALPRRQSLRATIDWSHDLLSEPERALLRRLSVFAGGWTFEAAEFVAAGEQVQPYAVLDLLTQLVDKSLVIAEERRGAVRYRLLETIRQYALERLRAAGEAEATRDRHLAYCLALAEEADPKLRGAESRLFLDRLEEEHANLRAALERAMASPDGGETALRLSGAPARFWWLRSHHDEGWRRLEHALARAPDASAARMKALHGAGYLAHHRRDSTPARELLGESLAIARARDDRWMVAWVLHSLRRVACYDDDPAAARAGRGEPGGGRCRGRPPADRLGPPPAGAGGAHRRLQPPRRGLYGPPNRRLGGSRRYRPVS